MVGGTPSPSAPRAEQEDYLEQFRHRTRLLLGEDDLTFLRSRTVAVAGCGGVGGATAITLCRLGVGGFVLADPGIYDPPDANRQWAARRSTMGRNKAAVHAELLDDIQPGVRLRVFEEGITEDNVDAFFEGADVLLDCLDISVPADLRARVYQTAMARGMYAVTSPIFGFGTMMVIAEPGGMPMDALIREFVRVASTESRLPPRFPEHFWPPHVAAIEREVHKHRVPTSSVAVTLASGAVAAELARILLRERDATLPPPPVLPDVLLIEPLRRTWRVQRYEELFRPLPAVDRATREAALATAGNNAQLAPAAHVELDLMSDSWGERPLPDAPTAESGASASERADAAYGVEGAMIVSRGRYAEALLAPLIAGSGRVVGVVAPFPTARFHLRAAGARLVEVGDGLGGVDDAAVGALLDAGASAVWLEACNNELGGPRLDLDVVRAVRERCDRAGARLVLDVCRVWTDAVRGEDEPAAWVRALCGLADVCVGSLSKDLRTDVGALIACARPEDRVWVRDRVALMTGDGLRHGEDARIASLLADVAKVVGEGRARVAAVGALAEGLRGAGIEVARVGGHAVFLDALALLPHLTALDHPEQVLCNALYLEGVRAAPHLGEQRDDVRWVRLAVPVGQPLDVGRVVAAVRAVLATSDHLGGLVVSATPPGELGPYARRFAPGAP
ncbi:MAG: ThiF family adenylyltransferase [Alphaproteobacteria bacterium]|nr:ThiF family adenylyltransferase [Alphaproteobacteria bacterium]